MSFVMAEWLGQAVRGCLFRWRQHCHVTSRQDTGLTILSFMMLDWMHGTARGCIARMAANWRGRSKQHLASKMLVWIVGQWLQNSVRGCVVNFHANVTNENKKGLGLMLLAGVMSDFLHGRARGCLQNMKKSFKEFKDVIWQAADEAIWEEEEEARAKAEGLAGQLKEEEAARQEAAEEFEKIVVATQEKNCPPHSPPKALKHAHLDPVSLTLVACRLQEKILELETRLQEEEETNTTAQARVGELEERLEEEEEAKLRAAEEFQAHIHSGSFPPWC